MCRLFGFRSVILSQVHQSLVHADNALAMQSHEHPDGWGVCYYLEQTPHLIKSEKAAINDILFQRVSGVVRSNTVLAHIRNATMGTNDILNTHPFQYGKWVFAHNGNIENFSKYRHKLIPLIDPNFHPFILGDTDSEVLFYLIMSLFKKNFPLNQSPCVQTLIPLLFQTMEMVQKIIGPYHPKEDSDQKTYLTFLLTNGDTMLAHQAGKTLYYSTHKSRCNERDTCPSFAPLCETEAKIGDTVNHLIFSSEPLSGENIWKPMQNDQIIGVDQSMKLTIVNKNTGS